MYTESKKTPILLPITLADIDGFSKKNFTVEFIKEFEIK